MNLASPMAGTIPRRSLHDELTQRLRELITMGELAPGERVPERDLCERFGVSRTPLREALKVLASENVVTLRPNRGSVVSSLSLDELNKVFPVMGALEALSGEIACQLITDEEVASIRSLHNDMVRHWRAGELQPYFKLNQSIHQAILEATRNEILVATHRGLSARIMNIRYLANMSLDRWAQAVREHESMLHALDLRDGAALGGILRDHLANKLDSVRDWLVRLP